MPIAGLAVQSSLLRAYRNRSSAIADFQGLNLRGALNQGHSRNPRQGPELPSFILLSMVPAELEYEGVVVCSKRPPRYEPLEIKSRPIFQLKITVSTYVFSRC